VGLSENHLSLAAGYLEKGDDVAACRHLGLFLHTHPAHRYARLYHAELLLKLDRLAQAVGEYEQAIRFEQDEAKPDVEHLVFCHTQLVHIGMTIEDDYLVHLHRGIAMVLLARRRATLDDPQGELSTESLLCRAAAELNRARSLRPDAARPCWYLYGAWRQLAQPGPARRSLAEAHRIVPISDLTPAELGDLHLAAQSLAEPATR
jgi:tetratricopeptide (TPR) repeat protein